MLTLWVILLIIFVLLGKGPEFISVTIVLLIVLAIGFLLFAGLGVLALAFVLI